MWRRLPLTLVCAAVAFSGVTRPCAAAVFQEVTHAAGINHSQWTPRPGDTDLIHHMAGGAAAGDYDNDGWVDLFITRLDDTDILYRNLGNGKFQDVSTSAGFHESLFTNGATWGDIDRDGDQDLYVTNLQDPSFRNYLYINDGNGSFTEEAVVRGADLTRSRFTNGFSSAFGDYDRDGYLDLFTSEWNPDSGVGNSRLLRNLGAANPGSFEDVTVVAGVDVSVGHPAAISYAFAPTFSDMDQDGHVDLVVAGDFGGSRLFWNNGDGTFTNGTAQAGVGTDENGMGSAIGDYDGDGDLDWFVSSIYEEGGSCGGAQVCGWGASGNRLYQNIGDRRFVDVTDIAGVRVGGWGWGAEFLDYDNDGDLDLTHTNGVDFPGQPNGEVFVDDPTRFWENDNGQFRDVATQIGVTDNRSGKGLLTFDYDADGDLDIFVVNNSGQPVLYRNDGGNDNDWLRVQLIGSDSNLDGIGAKISVVVDHTASNEVLFREVNSGSNFLGQSETVAHFGLGDLDGAIGRVVVEWPSTSIVQVLEGVAPNMLLRITEPVPADWNHDGKVNAADLAIWIGGFGLAGGAAHTDGDSNHNGYVNGSDFLMWQRQSWSTVAAASSTSAEAVPELSGRELVLWSATLLLSCFRKRYYSAYRKPVLLG